MTGIRQVMHFFFIPNVEHHVVCLIQKPVGQGQAEGVSPITAIRFRSLSRIFGIVTSLK